MVDSRNDMGHLIDQVVAYLLNNQDKSEIFFLHMIER